MVADDDSRSPAAASSTPIAANVPQFVQQPRNASKSKRKTLFISYAREDELIKDRVAKTLRTFPTLVEAVWDDSRIESGQPWREEIERAVAGSQLAICLVSTDFLDSRFIKTTEMPLLLEAKRRGELTIHWTLVQPCNYKDHEYFSDTQAIYSTTKPLSGLGKTELDAALVEICKKLETATTS